MRIVGGTGLGHLLQCHHRTGCGIRLRHDLPAVVGLSDPGLRGLAGGGLSRLAVADARLLLDDRAHAADADDRTRHHQGHELCHHDVEEDQDRILDQRGDVADLHRVHADAVAARPDDQHDRDVHQEEREAVESGEQVVDADRVVRVVGERLVEALDFMAVAAERADDAHAGDVLAQHHVHAVDVALQLLEDARRLPNDQRRQDHDDHDDGEHDPAHLHVEHERQRDAHHAHDRHRQQDLQTHHQRLLDDVDVVEGAGDHRAGAELLEVAVREGQRGVVDRVADVAPDVGAQFGAQVAAGQRCRAGQECHGHHDRARRDDVVDAAVGGADVDHLGQDGRDEQRAGHVEQQREHRCGGQAFVRLDECQQ